MNLENPKLVPDGLEVTTFEGGKVLHISAKVQWPIRAKLGCFAIAAVPGLVGLALCFIMDAHFLIGWPIAIAAPGLLFALLFRPSPVRIYFSPGIIHCVVAKRRGEKTHWRVLPSEVKSVHGVGIRAEGLFGYCTVPGSFSREAKAWVESFLKETIKELQHAAPQAAPPLPAQPDPDDTATAETLARPALVPQNPSLALAGIVIACTAPLWQMVFFGWNIAAALMLILSDHVIRLFLVGGQGVRIVFLSYARQYMKRRGGTCQDAAGRLIGRLIIMSILLSPFLLILLSGPGIPIFILTATVLSGILIFYQASMPGAGGVPQIDWKAFPFGVASTMPEAWYAMLSDLSWVIVLLVISLVLCNIVARREVLAQRAASGDKASAGLWSNIGNQVLWVVLTAMFFGLGGVLVGNLSIPPFLVLVLYVGIRTTIEVIEHRNRIKFPQHAGPLLLLAMAALITKARKRK